MYFKYIRLLDIEIIFLHVFVMNSESFLKLLINALDAHHFNEKTLKINVLEEKPNRIKECI